MWQGLMFYQMHLISSRLYPCKPWMTKTTWGLDILPEALFLLSAARSLPVYVPTSGSCRNRCYELVEAEAPNCRCDNLCKAYRSCCSDFNQLCLRTGTATQTCLHANLWHLKTVSLLHCSSHLSAGTCRAAAVPQWSRSDHSLSSSPGI